MTIKVHTVEARREMNVFITARSKASPLAKIALKLGQYIQSKTVPIMAQTSESYLDPSNLEAKRKFLLRMMKAMAKP